MDLTLSCKKINLVEKTNGYEADVSKEISKDELITSLSEIYDYECQENSEKIVFLRLKGLDVNLISAAIEYSLLREDLKNPLMILNIINLIKIYNTLDDSFFETNDVYFNNISDFIDAKLILRDSLKNFSKKVSIYFISLLRSYYKTNYTSSENYIELPNIYKIIFLSTDFMTLCGIFANCGNFDTKECVTISDSISILSQLLMKHSISMAFFDEFAKNNMIEEQKNDNN